MKRILVAALLLAGCGSGSFKYPSMTTPSPSPLVLTTSTPVHPGIAPLRRVAPGFVLPNRALTPGAVQSTKLSDICPHTNPAFEAARPGTAVKEQVYREYDILTHVSGAYEIDHLVPLELGGANDIKNLWPEPNDHPRPGALNSKDLLENKLHAMVCAGQLSMTEAQKAIAANWVAVYRKYYAGG